MAHNGLRRDIATWKDVVYPSADAQVLVADNLLKRVLAALGGPVAAQQIPPRVAVVPITEELAKALDAFKGGPIYPSGCLCGTAELGCPQHSSTNKGAPGCPPVDAVSSVEGGTECNPHAFEDIARENREAIDREKALDRETIELINRRLHPVGFEDDGA